VCNGVATNYHVIDSEDYELFHILMADSDPKDTQSNLTIKRAELNSLIVCESKPAVKDYAVFELKGAQLERRHRFEFSEDNSVAIGEQILFMGFPFSIQHLTAHLGFISSIHECNGVQVYQIDGSVNGGNSGGPMVDLKSRKVAGIVTRALKGTLDENFQKLIKVLDQNVRTLSQSRARLKIGGVDPIEGVKVSQIALKQIAENLYLTANVGIGYAFSSKYIREDLVKQQA